MPWTLYPREKDQVTIVQETGWAPGPVWADAKSSPQPGSDPRTVQPLASRCTDWAIPAHPELHVSTKNSYYIFMMPNRILLTAYLYNFSQMFVFLSFIREYFLRMSKNGLKVMKWKQKSCQKYIKKVLLFVWCLLLYVFRSELFLLGHLPLGVTGWDLFSCSVIVM